MSPLPDLDPYGPRLRDTYSRVNHLVNATLAGHHHLSLIFKGYKHSLQIVYNLQNLTVTYVEPFDFDSLIPKKFLGALRDLPTSQMDLQDDCLMLIGQRHVENLKDDLSEAKNKSGFFSNNLRKQKILKVSSEKEYGEYSFSTPPVGTMLVIRYRYR